NKRDRTIHPGATSALSVRVHRHRALVPAFTKRYGLQRWLEQGVDGRAKPGHDDCRKHCVSAFHDDCYALSMRLMTKSESHADNIAAPALGARQEIEVTAILRLEHMVAIEHLPAALRAFIAARPLGAAALELGRVDLEIEAA